MPGLGGVPDGKIKTSGDRQGGTGQEAWAGRLPASEAPHASPSPPVSPFSASQSLRRGKSLLAKRFCHTVTPSHHQRIGEPSCPLTLLPRPAWEEKPQEEGCRRLGGRLHNRPRMPGDSHSHLSPSTIGAL